jgi:hypothetical protein
VKALILAVPGQFGVTAGLEILPVGKCWSTGKFQAPGKRRDVVRPVS